MSQKIAIVKSLYFLQHLLTTVVFSDSSRKTQYRGVVEYAHEGLNKSLTYIQQLRAVSYKYAYLVLGLSAYLAAPAEIQT
jgi:uncharacterized membrane protein